MASYSVTVVVDPKWIRQFRSGKMNLCTSFGVTSSYSKTTYDIIATHEDPAPLNTISWSDQYSIAACKGPTRYGAFVTPSTIPTEIKYGQSVKLREDWIMELPDSDSKAPGNGFLFMNKPTASALLFKYIRNTLVPVYVTTVDGAAPPGQHSLVPHGQVLLFFGNFEARSAFEPNQVTTTTHEYSYLDHPHVTVYYTSEGTWETISDSTSDAVAVDISAVLADHWNKVKLPSGGVTSPPSPSKL